MENIKASEVTNLLKSQLENFESSLKMEEVGTVLSVADGVAQAYGLDNVQANELV